jgi:hypothetical protein
MHPSVAQTADAIIEASAAVLFAVLGAVILIGLLRSGRARITENPLAYSTIWIFWASTFHRTVDTYLAVRGEREASPLRLAADAVILAGLLTYFIFRAALHDQLAGRVILFRDRAAMDQERRIAQVLSTSAELERAKAAVLSEQAKALLTPLKVLRQYAEELEQGSVSPKQIAQVVPVLAERFSAVEDVLEAMTSQGRSQSRPT